MAGNKRSNDSAVNSNSPKKARRPMHCRSCEGAPLIKDCGCRKKPRTQAKKAAVANEQLPPPIPGTPPPLHSERYILTSNTTTTTALSGGATGIAMDLHRPASLPVVSFLFIADHANC